MSSLTPTVPMMAPWTSMQDLHRYVRTAGSSHGLRDVPQSYIESNSELDACTPLAAKRHAPSSRIFNLQCQDPLALVLSSVFGFGRCGDLGSTRSTTTRSSSSIRALMTVCTLSRSNTHA